MMECVSLQESRLNGISEHRKSPKHALKARRLEGSPSASGHLGPARERGSVGRGSSLGAAAASCCLLMGCGPGWCAVLWEWQEADRTWTLGSLGFTKEDCL